MYAKIAEILGNKLIKINSDIKIMFYSIRIGTTYLYKNYTFLIKYVFWISKK